MRSTAAILLTLLVLGTRHTAAASGAVTVTLDPSTAGAPVSPDFIGLSFEMEKLLPRPDGTRFFSRENKALLATFRTLGIKSLRVGGNTADRPGVPLPSPADIDSLFAFAEAAGVKVLYTLRLREGSREDAAAAATYISGRHAARLTCFAIGNEPNVFAKEYPAYLAEWRRYVAAITAPGRAPGARFCGPSATPAKVAWARDFVTDVAGEAPLAVITQHDYPGESARKVTDPAAARRLMLSPAWASYYQRFHDAFVPAVSKHTLPYRLEEANSFFHGGAKDVSDTMAAALWALDYMHWWSAHGAAGINFHTGDEVAAGEANTPCRYAAFWTSPGGYLVHPIGHALKAFDLGAQGRRVSAAVAPSRDDLTAYAVLDDQGGLAVTLIHKAVTGAPITATLDTGREYMRGRVQLLRAPGDDASATTGVTLGGAPIAEDATWKGAWTELDSPFSVTLPPATAAVVQLRR
jgi:hypothetical protein